MKKNIIRFSLSIFFYGLIFAQGTNAMGSMMIVIITATSEGYAASQNSLQVFRRRFTEILNNTEFNNNAGDISSIYY